MKMRQMRMILIATAALGAGMLAGAPSFAQAAAEPITAGTLIDRALIEDMLTRYMTDLGHSSTESYAAYYAEDAELILGGKTYKGHAGVASAYAAARAAPGNTRGQAHAFNALLSNPLIVVSGDTATAQFIFTETIVDKPGSAPRLLVQGREYDELARIGGRWLFKKRTVTGDAKPPAGWQAK